MIFTALIIVALVLVILAIVLKNPMLAVFALLALIVALLIGGGISWSR